MLQNQGSSISWIPGQSSKPSVFYNLELIAFSYNCLLFCYLFLYRAYYTAASVIATTVIIFVDFAIKGIILVSPGVSVESENLWFKLHKAFNQA